MAKFKPRKGRSRLRKREDFVVDDHRRIRPADMRADPVNLIRISHLRRNTIWRSIPTRCGRRALHAKTDRPRCPGSSRRPTSCSSGNPDFGEQQPEDGAGRIDGADTRCFRAGIRPRGRDDRTQYVPSLHSGRASPALHRRAQRYRARRQRGIQPRQRPHSQDPAGPPRITARDLVPARHRQRPHRGSLDRQAHALHKETLAATQFSGSTKRLPG